MRLYELFDKSLPYEWNNLRSSNPEATFKDNNYEYLVGFTLESDNPITFDIYYGCMNNDDNFANTGFHNEFNILPTIVTIIKDFINKENPDKLTFSGTIQDGKAKLYNMMVNKLSKNLNNLNYKVTKISSNTDSVHFSIQKNIEINLQNDVKINYHIIFLTEFLIRIRKSTLFHTLSNILNNLL